MVVSRILPSREAVENPTEIENRIRRHYRINQRSTVEVAFDEHGRRPSGIVEINGRAWAWRIAFTGLELRHPSGGTPIWGAETFAQMASLSDEEVERRNTTTRFGLAIFTALCLALAALGRMAGLLAAPIGYLGLACISTTLLILHCASRTEGRSAAPEAASAQERAA